MFFKLSKTLPILIGIAFLAISFSGPTVAQDGAGSDQVIKNLQFQAAEMRSVLDHLADYGGVNVVVAPNVEGNVTIRLNDIHWRTAMDIIGRTYNLAIVDDQDGYIRVLTSEDYRKEVTEGEKHKKETRELAALETRIVEVSNATSADIVDAVESLISERGKATADKHSNSIVLQDVPSNIDKVVAFIKQLDRPARQIKISTQLVELYTDDLSELGFSWNANGTYTTESGRAYPQEIDLAGNRLADVAGTYSVAALQHGWTAEAMVEAIVTSGKGKIVAHPEITTIDNKEAKIQMGQKVPVKQFDESGNVVIKFEEVGTMLTVTPHITAENQILMHLKPERSTYQFDPNGVIINTSNAETNVIVHNGQTAVIGGLTTQDETESETGIPILKDIPVFGMFFKATTKSMESRDLVIFVTPTIIEADLAMEG